MTNEEQLSRVRAPGLIFRRLLLSLLFFNIVAVCADAAEHSPLISSGKQATAKSLPVEIIPEPDSPVIIESAKTELDLDDFGSPVAARTYVEYKNSSKRPIAAVRFRLRYVDSSGKDRGVFHAPHAAIVSPGSEAEGKWKGRVVPGIAALKVRPLSVRFTDGTDWKSTKMIEIEKRRLQVH